MVYDIISMSLGSKVGIIIYLIPIIIISLIAAFFKFVQYTYQSIAPPTPLLAKVQGFNLILTVTHAPDQGELINIYK